jgi:hypothetical protein
VQPLTATEPDDWIYYPASILNVNGPTRSLCQEEPGYEKTLALRMGTIPPSRSRQQEACGRIRLCIARAFNLTLPNTSSFLPKTFNLKNNTRY